VVEGVWLGGQWVGELGGEGGRTECGKRGGRESMVLGGGWFVIW